MFENIFGIISRKRTNHTKKYKEIIKDFYNTQYIYCESCIRNYNKQCKMILCVRDNQREQIDQIEKEECYGCFNCYSSIPLSSIKDDNYIFDTQELKEYILKDDSYYKIKCLLIFWKQSKKVICDNHKLNEILNDLKDDNFHTLFEYDPYYIQV